MPINLCRLSAINVSGGRIAIVQCLCAIVLNLLSEGSFPEEGLVGLLNQRHLSSRNNCKEKKKKKIHKGINEKIEVIGRNGENENKINRN